MISIVAGIFYQMNTGVYEPETNLAASSIAAVILEHSATPFPAISKAVPWSTDVLINGSPRVTLTPELNDIDFTGIVA